MMINPVSILPNAINSSTAEKRKQRDNRHPSKKTSHQAEENPSSTDSSPFSKASGEGFEENEEELTPKIDITV